jgi:hypothetical protein
MKGKTVFLTIVVLLLSLFLPSLILISEPVTATGTHYASIMYGSRWNQTVAEYEDAWAACCDIYDLFEDQIVFVPWYYFQLYDHLYNLYGSPTTQSRVRSEAAHCEYYHDYTTVFHHGHGGKWGYGDEPPWYYFYYADAPPQNPSAENIDDWQDIRPYTIDNHQFVFLWACAQGNEVGGPLDPEDHYGHGMPWAWTKRDDLNLDGYADPDTTSYCFIGFENMSKSISEPTGNGRYKHFLVFFYYYALETQRSIKQALDKATEMVWGSSNGWHYFHQTELYNGWTEYVPGPNPPGGEYDCRMRVFGNGNNHLPRGNQ